MPVAGFVLIAVGLVLWLCNWLVINALPRRGDKMLEDTTPEALIVSLESFNRRVKNAGRVSLLAAGLTFIGAVLVLLG